MLFKTSSYPRSKKKIFKCKDIRKEAAQQDEVQSRVVVPIFGTFRDKKEG